MHAICFSVPCNLELGEVHNRMANLPYDIDLPASAGITDIRISKIRGGTCRLSFKYGTGVTYKSDASVTMLTTNQVEIKVTDTNGTLREHLKAVAGAIEPALRKWLSPVFAEDKVMEPIIAVHTPNTSALEVGIAA